MNNTSNVDTHKANEYLELCQNAEDAFYHIKREKTGSYKTSRGGYTALEIGDKTDLTGSHFKAVLFKKGNEYVISFFGTDTSSPKDLYADIKMGLHGTPKQFIDAVTFTNEIMLKYQIPLEKLTVIGHSEGGSEAIHVKAMLGIPQAYTFNPFIPDASDYPKENLQNIYNFRTPNDIVSKIGAPLGEDFIVPLTVTPRKGPKYMSDTHRVDHIDDCTKAKPVADYQKENKNFVDKYRSKRLTIKDIEEIPSELYELAEADIRFSILSNGIETHQEANNCVGTYYVSGYTREDGKKVSGYARRCGAKHDN